MLVLLIRYVHDHYSAIEELQGIPNPKLIPDFHFVILSLGFQFARHLDLSFPLLGD